MHPLGLVVLVAYAAMLKVSLQEDVSQEASSPDVAVAGSVSQARAAFLDQPDRPVRCVGARSEKVVHHLMEAIEFFERAE